MSPHPLKAPGYNNTNTFKRSVIGERMLVKGRSVPKWPSRKVFSQGQPQRRAGAAGVMVQGSQDTSQEAQPYTGYRFFRHEQIQEGMGSQGLSLRFQKTNEARQCVAKLDFLPESLGDHFITLERWSLSWSGDSSILEMLGTWDIHQGKLKSQSGTDRLSPNQ